MNHNMRHILITLLVVLLPVDIALAGAAVPDPKPSKKSSSSSARSKSYRSKPTQSGPRKSLQDMANEAFNAGLELQKAKQYDKAIAKYHQAIKHNSQFAEAYSNMGFCYRKRKAYKNAIRYYKTALKIDPKLAAAHEYIGEAYVEMAVAAHRETERYMRLSNKHLQALDKLGGGEEATELRNFITKGNRHMGRTEAAPAAPK